jgi:hypothetical protein
MWSKKWYRAGIRCGKQSIQFIPIYYLPNSKGLKRQASGPAKYFVSCFVEYPTGAREPKDTPKPAENSETGSKPGQTSTPAAKADPSAATI